MACLMQKKIPVFDEDEVESVPLYDVFDEDEIEQVTDRKRKDESIYDSVYAQENPNFPNEDLVNRNGVTCDFLKDKSPLLETMIATVGRSDNFFPKNSRSNNSADRMDGPKQELIHICDERVSNSFLNLQKKHMSYGARTNNFNRHINREPPDRVPYQGHEAEQEDTKTLTGKITKLEEALLLEQEKNWTLEHKLRETRRNIRMLNRGSKTLDKILRMGSTEKTMAGLGYQGGPSRSHTVFVRSNSVETNKPDVVFESAKNPAMKLPTVSDVYTLYYEVSLSKHQGCVRRL